MRAAVGSGDIVYERKNVFAVTVGMLHGNFDDSVVFLRGKMEGVGIQNVFALVYIADVIAYAAIGTI